MKLFRIRTGHYNSYAVADSMEDAVSMFREQSHEKLEVDEVEFISTRVIVRKP